MKREKWFINISNHPSDKWSEEQLAATASGTIDDYQFPNVPAEATLEEIKVLARDFLDENFEIQAADVAMVQGEFVLTQVLVRMLQEHGVRCVAACSRRDTVENKDGTKTVKFSFVQFREYEGNPQKA